MEDIQDIYELSSMQHGILFQCLYTPDIGAYFQQFSCTFQGNLNVSLFKQAWQQVIERHTVLRTSFHWKELSKPLQVVHRQIELSLQQYDYRSMSLQEQKEHLEAFFRKDREQGFELSKAPVTRLCLIQIAEDTYKFVWSHHHILLDGWSVFFLLNEVFTFYYKALCQGKEILLEQPRPYKDYIAWLQQQELSKTQVFWQQVLKGFTAPTLLGVDKAPGRLVEQKDNYREQQLQLSAATTATLQSFASKHQLTLNTLVQGAWGLLLSCYSGKEDVLFGAVVSGRPAELEGVEAMVGLFINTLPVRLKISSNSVVLSWLKQLQNQQAEARQYEYTPLVQIQRWSDIPHGQPLFESILAFQSYPIDVSLQKQSESLNISDVHFIERTHYPLTLVVVPGVELSFQLIYNEFRFDAAIITRMLGHLQTLLVEMVVNFDQRLSDISVLKAEERHQLLLEWNDTQINYPEDKCIHKLFEAQVEKTPDAVAVVFKDEHLTYQELNDHANQLAHHLKALGVGPEVLVGICMERSPKMMVGLLGIMKAGGAYLPLDPTYPKERLTFILQDSQPLLLLIQERLLEIFPEYNLSNVVCVDIEWETITQKSTKNPDSNVVLDNLAYVLYTSGSTGKPKGIAMRHCHLPNLISWQLQTSLLSRGTRTLQFASLNFDISIQESFSTWCSGETLVLISEELRQNLAQLWRFIADEAVERIFLPFVVLQQLAEIAYSQEQIPSSLREIITAGEQLQINRYLKNLFEKLEGCTLHNQYGPSECHVVTNFTLTSLPSTWSGLPPIGLPIANIQLYLLDSHLKPVPIGIPGELYIGGVPLARGYFNRYDLTAEKFIPNPFSNKPGARFYKTGDLARYLPDGNIEFLGRIDNQVKVRGFRIELGEIEVILSQHQAVQKNVVVVRDDVQEEKRLIAYIVPEEKQAPNSSLLRRFLIEKLPEYMVPSVFVMLEALPLDPNGKVNRKALPAPAKVRPELEAAYVVPQTKTEQIIADVWQEVLQIEKVGIHDNFFELGGHSLLMLQVHNKLEEDFKNLSMVKMFKYPTIHYLAKYLSQVSEEQFSVQKSYDRASLRRESMKKQRQFRQK